MMSIKHAAAACALALSAFSAQAAYVVGGAGQALISNSGDWAWDGAFIAGLRAALENPSNFGPGGIVNRSITTTTLGTVDAASLATVNMFVGTWVSDSQAAPMQAAVVNFFLTGGDLFLLQDDDSHDGLGSALGISTTASTGSVSNGGAPLYVGPFGTATDVTQHYNVGRLSEADVLARNGRVAGRNADDEVTAAYWLAGEYAPGAGALFIVADIDMVATTSSCGLPVCGATYDPLNSNGIYALNTFAFLQQTGGSPDNGGSPVPLPGTSALLGLGLGMAALLRRRRA